MHNWEKEFRLEMAGLLGREGKFAMNEMVELVTKYAPIIVGQKGGNKTLLKYGKNKMTKWGKTGGRPKKQNL